MDGLLSTGPTPSSFYNECTLAAGILTKYAAIKWESAGKQETLPNTNIMAGRGWNNSQHLRWLCSTALNFSASEQRIIDIFYETSKVLEIQCNF